MKKALFFLSLLLLLSCENAGNMVESFNQAKFLSKQKNIKSLKGCSFDYSVSEYMPNIIVASVKQGEPNKKKKKINGYEKEHFVNEEVENWEYWTNEYSQFIFASLDELYSFVLLKMNEYKEDNGYSMDCSVKWNEKYDCVFDSICMMDKKKGIGGDIVFKIDISNFVCEQ